MTDSLRVENIYKSYRKRAVVDGATFDVNAAEVVGLLGPNGAGKTTSFYITIGLIHPDAGSIYLNDHNITRLPIHRRARLGLSYLPQEASVFRKLSVLDNILAILELCSDLNRRQRRERAQQLMRELNIEHLQNVKGLSLSGGERRRTEIARTLAGNPKFILLDEPFAGVDPIAVADIRAIISHLTDQGIGVLITDHNVRETLKICHKAFILNEGRVISQGSAAEIVADPLARAIYLGENFRLDDG